jgi:uncharacterized membrane protein YtjA (UPF0391 family)
MIALAVMFGRRPVALRGGFVVFRRLIIGVLRHANPPSLSCDALERPRAAIVPGVGRLIFGKRDARSRLLVRLLEHARDLGVYLRQQPAQRQEDIMFGWAIAFLIIALIAGALGFGVVAGTAFAAAKIIFVVALVAFLISAVLGFSRRGVP